MDKIKSLLGSPRQEREEYEQCIKKLQAEDAMRNQYSQASPYQQGLQRASQAINPYQQTPTQERYGQGWATKPVSPEEYVLKKLTDTNQAMKQLAERMGVQERRIDMLSGFYTWITEVHPEIAAQHKAMRDLYEAANSNETQGRQT